MSYVGSDVGSIRIEARLAVGGMGEVYLGYDPRLDRRVAVKTLRRDERMSPDVKARFLREARLLSKLGHPGICQVYDLVETPEADFLILEYVPGRTLREWAEREKPALPARLRVAEQIATALAAAHREKIVHRDLKADNVMVTPDGAVKVLDFGIARSVQEPPVVLLPPPELPEVPLTPNAVDASEADRAADLLLDDTAQFPVPPPGSSGFSTRADGYLTQQGTVMGTLGAMSPEQAGGEHITESSDLYSFGILLQELVTGKPAYDKSGGEMERLRRVLRAETLPVALDPEDADLARLIQDLQCLDPRRRPTAEETAGRLRWILDAPQRRRRRRLQGAALAAAFALLLVVLAVVSWLAIEAERAHREAERRRAQAEGLIGFMLDDLRPRLEAVERLDLLDKVGDRALAYFAEVPEGQLTAAELNRRIQALAQIGEVRYSQGRLPAALAAFRRAEALALDLVGDLAGDRPAAHPSAALREIEARLLTARSWIGQIHYDQGDAGAALRVWQRTLERGRAVLASSPGDPEWINHVALAHHNVGTALELRGDLAGALAHYRANLALQRRLAARAPQDAEIQAQVANTLGFVSAALERQGDLAGALARRREFLAIQQRLATRDPDDPQRQHELAVAQGYVALTLAVLGTPGSAGSDPEAQALAERGFAITDRLAARDPDNALQRRWLGAFHSTLGTLAAVRGDTAEALRQLGAARTLFEQLVAQDATNRDSLLQLGVCRVRTALALEASSPARALAEARAGAALLAPLREGADDAVRGHLAEAAATRGRIAAALGDRTTAMAAWQEALAVVAAADPPVGHWRLLDARAQALLGLGRTAEAQAVLGRLQAMGYRSAALDAMVGRTGASPAQPPP